MIAFVSEAEQLTPDGWDDGENLVEHALSQRGSGVRRRVRLLVRILDAWSLLRRGRRVSRLEPLARRGMLRTLERSRLLILRRGIWGLRTLAFLLYYGRPAVHSELGYRARSAGWETRRGDRPGGEADHEIDGPLDIDPSEAAP